MRFLSLFILLLIFWIFQSGQSWTLHFFLLGCGLVCCAAVAWLGLRMGAGDKESDPFPFIRGSLGFVPWLVKEIIVSNIDVAKRVWLPNGKITPQVFRIPCKLKTAWGVTTYANSITLTPGTVTISVDDDSFLIHSLTKEAAEDLLTGAMEAKVRRLEGSDG